MFGFGKNKKSHTNVAIVDCQTGAIQESKKFPITLGGDDSTIKTNIPTPFLEISKDKNGEFELAPLNPEDNVKINGVRISAPIKFSDAVTMQIGEHLFYIITDPQVLERARNMDTSKWLVFYSETGRIEDEVPFERLIVSYFLSKSNAEGVEFTKYLRRGETLTDKSAPNGDTET